MINCRVCIISLLGLLVSNGASAQERTDTIDIHGVKILQHDEKWDYYNPERGFFQKAFVDKGDPRFMITNENGTFEFGVGGTLRITAFEDINGSVDHNRFSTFDIPVPTDHAHQFGINMATSKVFFKSRAKFGKQQLVSYLEIFNNEANEIKLGQAYVSYAGLSVGKTYSFFMDLAAGVQTVDLRGANTGIDRTHALVGYTYNKGKWTLAASAERPEFNLQDYTEFGITEEFQSMPDFAAKVVYKDAFGHIQLSGLARSLGYWALDEIGKQEITGSTHREFGFGISLSGTVNFTPNFFLTFQTMYGKGIQQYIRDFADTRMDLVIAECDDGTSQKHYKMKVPYTCGGYVGAQYKVTDKLTASATLGLVSMDIDEVQKLDDVISMKDYFYYCKYFDYKSTSYLAVNAFYHLNDYCTVGLEYLNGMRWQRNRDFETRTLTGGTDRGVANRIDLMFSYSF